MNFNYKHYVKYVNTDVCGKCGKKLKDFCIMSSTSKEDKKYLCVDCAFKHLSKLIKMRK